MRNFVTGIVFSLIASSASAGVIVDIKISRDVPDMVAEAAWDIPMIESGRSLAPSVAPKAVLWQSSVTVTQKAGKAVTAFDIAGDMPAHVPVGALFTEWRLANGTNVQCTRAAEVVGAPGKATFAVCLTPDGGATVRKIGKCYSEAVGGSLSSKPVLTNGIMDADNARTTPWPGPVLFFSYKQLGERGAILREPTNRGAIMAVGQLSLGQRIVLGSIKGDLATLEHRTFDLDDYTNALSARKDSGYKEAETTVNLANGPQQVTLGGGRFRVSRTPEGLIAVEGLVPSVLDCGIDPTTGRLMIDGRPYVQGAQEI